LFFIHGFFSVYKILIIKEQYMSPLDSYAATAAYEKDQEAFFGLLYFSPCRKKI